MPPEKTQAHKKQFCSLYWGQNVAKIKPYDKLFEVGKDLHLIDYLELTPISRISHEDAVSIVKLKLTIEGEAIGIENIIIESLEYQKGRESAVLISAIIKRKKWDDAFQSLFLSSDLKIPYQLVDELRRRGYYVGNGIEIEYGWCKFKTK